MKRLLKLSLILLPFFIIPLKINQIHINMRDARELLFQSLVIVGLAILIRNKWIRFFLYWAVLNWWLNFFLPPQSTAILFNIFFGCFIFYLIKEFIRPTEIEGILKLICLTALFQVFWLGIQALNLDFVFYHISSVGEKTGYNTPLVGWLGNKNILAAYLAFCVPLFRVYYKKLIVFVFIGLLVAKSSIGLVAASTGLLIFEIFIAIQQKNYKKFVLTISILLGVITFFFLSIDNFGLERLAIWKKLIVHTFNWKCLIGQGLGKYQTLLVIDATGTRWDNPHNEYLQVYFELGLVGLFFIFAYLTGLYKRFIRLRSEKTIVLFSCCVVVLIESLGMFPFQIAPTAFLGITFFALLENILCQNRQAILLTR